MPANQKTALAPYVSRFTWVYLAFTIAATIFIAYFSLTRNTGLGVGILMASAVAAGQKFLQEQKRLPSGGEKLRLSAYSMIVVLLAALVAVVGWSYWQSGSLQEITQAIQLVSPQLGLLIAAGTALLSFAILYLSYSFVLNMIYKGMEKRGEL